MEQAADREDLVAEALTYLGASQQSQGNLAAAVDLFHQARAKGGACFSAALANYPLTLYLSGRLREAVERAREAAEVFRGTSDAFASAFGHPHLGLALAGQGRYAEAAAVFEEAKQMGMKHEIWHFRARAIGMSAGFHLDVFDFQGNELLAREAREQACSAPFWPTAVSATIDLAFNFARRGQVSQAETSAKEAEALITKVAGWHEWLWRLSMKQAHAEVACAREELAIRSEAGLRRHWRKPRFGDGLNTPQRALKLAPGRWRPWAERRKQLGTCATRLDWRAPMGDPALFIRAVAPLLQIDGSDALLSEARTTARQIIAALPNDEMRQRFQAARPVQSLGQI